MLRLVAAVALCAATSYAFAPVARGDLRRAVLTSTTAPRRLAARHRYAARALRAGEADGDDGDDDGADATDGAGAGADEKLAKWPLLQRMTGSAKEGTTKAEDEAWAAQVIEDRNSEKWAAQVIEKHKRSKKKAEIKQRVFGAAASAAAAQGGPLPTKAAVPDLDRSLPAFLEELAQLGEMRFIVNAEGAVLEAVGTWTHLRESANGPPGATPTRLLTFSTTLGEMSPFECHVKAESVHSVEMVNVQKGSKELHIIRLKSEAGTTLLSSLLHAGRDGLYAVGAVARFAAMQQLWGRQWEVDRGE